MIKTLLLFHMPSAFLKMTPTNLYKSYCLSKSSTSQAGSPNRSSMYPGPIGSFFKNPDTFDYAFFNVSAQEANLMDRQQRLLLELAWHCFESRHIPLEHLQKQSPQEYLPVRCF